ncbi:CvpA family protein [Sphingomonas bacterium]|uniref:CvpA family protein n=1 Tax=Sphingomonas bacterium TaxID=1895847 RepID=UPI001575B228|nr:CvpA family protein [Sphingomonas bacterium]
MGLTALDMLVLVGVAGSAMLGLTRGFVTEVLSLFAWVAVVFAMTFFHAGLAAILVRLVGTVSGAAVLAFALIAGITYFGGRMVANALGRRTRNSVLGPVDRALGFGFGALKGLILASLAFLPMLMLVDIRDGGPSGRPDWMVRSRSYPLLSATSASMADMIDRRRHGRPVFGTGDNALAVRPEHRR